MAGIAGVLRLDGAPLDDASSTALASMGVALAHRGLGSRRVARDGALGLVLPANGDARSEAGGHVLVALDGRLSNRRALRLRTERPDATDEELVAALYARDGEAFVEKLEGTFAIALWDPRRARLLLARDRLGVRPLHRAVVGRWLIFGSELKALLAHPECPRDVDWVRFLSRQALPRRTAPLSSFIEGVEMHAAGSLLVADARSGIVDVRRYWAIRHPSAEEQAADRRTEGELGEAWREALGQAVDDAMGDERERTGLLLSGGIDSIAIAALARRHASIPTFTVLSQSTFGNGDARRAHEAAAALGLPNHQVLFRVQEPPDPDHYRRLLWATETPFCSAQHLYKVHLARVAREVRPDLAVLLNGEGADELVGADFRNSAEEGEGGFDAYIADLVEKQRDDLLTLEALAVEQWVGRTVWSRDALAREAGRPLPRSPWRRRIDYCLEGFQEDVLWRDDRLAASHGMSSEAPFVHPRVVELAVGIPDRLHAALFWEKKMARDAMAPLLPEALRSGPKIPFFGGVDSRYTSRLLLGIVLADDRALLHEAFGDALSHPRLAPGLVGDILDECLRDPRASASELLLFLVNLALLEKMAREAAQHARPVEPLPCLRTVAWDEENLATLLVERRAIDLDAPLAFGPNVYLVRPDTHGEGGGTSYLIVDDEVRYEISGEDTQEWREVLRRVDGRRSLSSILREIEVEERAVRKHLEEALDHEVLTFGAR